MADDRPTPTGRDEVRRAVISVAARHFAERGTTASLRSIAGEAGVNLGLIHRHIGNKDDLLRAVLEEGRWSGTQLVESADSLPAAVAEVFRRTAQGADYVRTIAWLLLEGRHTGPLQDQYPTIARLRAMTGGPEHEAALLAAMTIVYGWSVFGPELLAAFEIADDEVAAAERGLVEVLEALVAAPTGRDDPGARPTRHWEETSSIE